jgi:hypothetical protein
VDKLFGIVYVLKLEPTVFNMACMLAAEYDGTYWQFFTLSKGGFFMDLGRTPFTTFVARTVLMAS